MSTVDAVTLRTLLTADVSDFDTKLKQAAASLQEFAQSANAVKVRIEAEGAIKEVTDLGRAMRQIKDKTITVTVNTAGAVAQVTALGNAMAQVQAKARSVSSRAGVNVNGQDLNYQQAQAFGGKWAKAIDDDAKAMQGAQAKARAASRAGYDAQLQEDERFTQAQLAAIRKREENVAAAMAQATEREQKARGQQTDRFGTNISPVVQQPSLAERSRSMRMEGRRNFSEGTMLTASIDVPVIAATVGIVKLSAEFDDKMKHIAAMTDIGGASIGKFHDAILQMSRDPKIRVGPNDLADALYFAASRGFKGAEAMTLLKQSALGASAGMGKVADVMEADTAVLNAYNMKASETARVNDILTMGAKMGGATSESFAKALPKVIATASQLHIPIEQVVANIATLTRIGIPAQNAATSLNALLVNFEKPSDKARKTLAGLGLSFAQLRHDLEFKGLRSTVAEVLQKTGGDVEKVATIFGRIQSLKNVLSTSAQPDNYREIDTAVANAGGATMSANAEASKSAAFQFEHLKNVAISVGIELGDKLLPKITPLVEKIGRDLPDAVMTAIAAWNALPAPLKVALETLGALVLLAGPITMIAGALQMLGGAVLVPIALIGGLTGGVAALQAVFAAFLAGGAVEGFTALGLTLTPLLPILAAVAAVAGVGYVAFRIWRDHTDKLADAQQKLNDIADKTARVMDQAMSASGQDPAILKTMTALRKQIMDAGGDSTKLDAALKRITEVNRQVSLSTKLGNSAKALLMDDLGMTSDFIVKKEAVLKVKMDEESKSWWQQFMQKLDSATGYKPNEEGGFADTSQSVALGYGVVKDALGMGGHLSKRINLPGVYPLGDPGRDKNGDVIDLWGDPGDPNNPNGTHQQNLKAFQKDEAARKAHNAKVADLKGQAVIDDKANAEAQQAIADENARRLRAIESKSLGERISMYSTYSSAVQSAMGKLQTFGDKSEKTREAAAQVEKMKLMFQGIPEPLANTVLYLGKIYDKLNDITGVRDKLRQTFSELYKSALANGGDTSAILRDASFAEKRLDYARTMQREVGKGVGLAVRSVNSTEDLRGGLQVQQEALNEQRSKSVGVYGGGGGSQLGIAQSFIGMKGGDNRAPGLLGSAYGEEWCAGFVRGVLKKSGTSNWSASNLVSGVRTWAEKQGLAYRGTPDVGDVFTIKGGGHSHAGFVSGVSGNRFSSVAGNEGAKNNFQSRVKSDNTYSVNDPRIEFIRVGSGGATSSTRIAAGVPTMAAAYKARLLTAPPLPSYDGSLLTPLGKGWGASVSNLGMKPGEQRGIQQATQDALLGTSKDDLEKAAAAMKMSVTQYMSWMRGMAKRQDAQNAIAKITDDARISIRELGKQIRLVGKENNPVALLFEEFNNGADRVLSKGAKNSKLEMTLGLMVKQARQATAEIWKEQGRRGRQATENMGMLGAGYNPDAYDVAQQRTANKFSVEKELDPMRQRAETLRANGKIAQAQSQERLANQLSQSRQAAMNTADDKVRLESGTRAYAGMMYQQKESLKYLQLENRLLVENKLSREGIARAVAGQKAYDDALKELKKAHKNEYGYDARPEAEAARKATFSGIDKTKSSERVTALQDFNSENKRSIKLLNDQAALLKSYPTNSPALKRETALLEMRDQLVAKYQLKMQNGILSKADQASLYAELRGGTARIGAQQKSDSANYNANAKDAAKQATLDAQKQETLSYATTAAQKLQIEFDFQEKVRALRGETLDATTRAEIEAEQQKQIELAAQSEKNQKVRDYANSFKDNISQAISTGMSEGAMKGARSMIGTLAQSVRKAMNDLISYQITKAILPRNMMAGMKRPGGVREALGMFSGGGGGGYVPTSQSHPSKKQSLGSAVAGLLGLPAGGAGGTIANATFNVAHATINARGTTGGFNLSGAGSRPSGEQIWSSVLGVAANRM